MSHVFFMNPFCCLVGRTAITKFTNRANDLAKQRAIADRAAAPKLTLKDKESTPQGMSPSTAEVYSLV
jgi:hypothetical protein